MKESKYRFRLIKSILKSVGLFSDFVSGQSNAKRVQYVLLRKFYKFFNLYLNIRWYHFYYESPNSFMACKEYEFENMMKKTNLKDSDIILDLGCGEGALTQIIGKSVKKAIGVDTNCRLINDAKFKAIEIKGISNTEFHCNKLEDLNLQEGSFDKIFSFSVIEHIPNYLEIFQLIYKLLKSEGELVISVDSFVGFDIRMRNVHQKQFEVQKYFDKQELTTLLTSLGFKGVTVWPIFKSEFSKRWFTRVMNNPSENFKYFKRIYSFFLFYIIKYHERKIKQTDHGIFLLAKCTK